MTSFLYPYYQFLACLVALSVTYLAVSSFLRDSRVPDEIKVLSEKVAGNYSETQGLLAQVDGEVKQLREKAFGQLAEVQSELTDVSLALLDQGHELETGLKDLDRSMNAKRCRCDSTGYRRLWGRGSARLQRFPNHGSAALLGRRNRRSD
ncbi:hypothetical protein AOQ84DRAFT_198847 [Glonium stellatum]|uniref:Uncharacterized protein n=1 Tax=Glonium stellatum TaxID=574774 RepID=A0A8E2F651_9PEZI|nr:hypothetical protein AOQ84DRAFT_198847 [Glonium stellatum]